MKRFALILAALLFTAAPALALESQLESFGTGTVTVSPDQGYINVSVESFDASATEALRLNNETVKSIHEALGGVIGKDTDITTLGFNVADHYSEQPDSKNPGRFKNVKDGVQVVNTVRVTVCDLATFGKVLDAVVSNGASRVDSIVFGSSKPAEFHLKKARELALKQAEEKASYFATFFHMQVSEPISISDAAPYVARPSSGYQLRTMGPGSPEAAVAGDVPISGGALSYTVTVHVKWHLVKAQ